MPPTCPAFILPRTAPWIGSVRASHRPRPNQPEILRNDSAALVHSTTESFWPKEGKKEVDPRRTRPLRPHQPNFILTYLVRSSPAPRGTARAQRRLAQNWWPIFTLIQFCATFQQRISPFRHPHSPPTDLLHLQFQSPSHLPCAFPPLGSARGRPCGPRLAGETSGGRCPVRDGRLECEKGRAVGSWRSLRLQKPPLLPTSRPGPSARVKISTLS